MSKPTPKWYRAQLDREAREKLAREAAEAFYEKNMPKFYDMGHIQERYVSRLASAFLAFAESVEKMR